MAFLYGLVAGVSPHTRGWTFCTPVINDNYFCRSPQR